MSLNQGWIYEEQVTISGFTLLDYYTTRHTHSSQQQWRDRIESGLICIDRIVTIDPHTPLKPGQLLSYHRPPWVEPSVPFNVSVLYEDDALLIAHKPSGLPVLPGGGFLDHTLLGWLKSHYGDPPTPMHRLGRGTSGILLLAKTEAARSSLSQQFRARTIQKVYRALAIGTDQPDSFTVTHAIGKVAHPRLGYLYEATESGKEAVSHCQVLERYFLEDAHSTPRIPNTALLEVTIPTGRPHQIRIHLAAAGYPLWGDPLYGVGGTEIDQDSVPGDCGYYLHAYTASFTHPTQGHRLTVAAEPPDVLTQTID
jgi:23S rRNA pseudouridine1911/1915/1917 synthase